MNKKLLALLLFWPLLLLTACERPRDTEAVFDNYLYRLSNSLDVPRREPLPRAYLSAYPEKRQLKYAIPQAKINFLQFLQLSNCQLQRLIGQRNSGLGKHIDSYHQLLYHREFLLLAERCLSAMVEGDTLRAPLQAVINHKLEYRTQIYWNASFAGDEFRYLFSIASQPLQPEQIVSRPTELIESLQYLNAWMENAYLQADQLSATYQAIEHAKWLGRLRLTMALAIDKLSQADEMLEKRLNQRPLCYAERANRRFNHVKNVFFQFYIAEVQVILSKLHQQTNEILILVDQLKSKLPNRPEFAVFWSRVYAGENSEWQQFNQAITAHTLLWQKLLKQCGFVPGKLNGTSH